MFEILDKYIVFIIAELCGIILAVSINIFINSVKTKGLDTFFATRLLSVLSRVTAVFTPILFLFRITGSLFDSRYVQLGFMLMFYVVLTEVLTVSVLNTIQKADDYDIDYYGVRDDYKYITMKSPLMIVWMLFTVAITVGSYICAFFYFGKISATIATAFTIFVLNMFFGIEFLNRVNKEQQRFKK